MVFKVVVVFGPRSEEMVIDLCDTGEQFKTITVEQLIEETSKRTGLTTDEIRLIFEGKQLEDQKLLCDYGIQHMSTIFLRRRIRAGGTGLPEKRDGGMGDKDKNRSKECLAGF